MTTIPVWDGHCDSLTKWRIEDLLNDKEDAQWTVPKFRKGGGELQILAIYTPPEHTGKDAFHYAMKYMEAAHELVEQSKGAVRIVHSARDLDTDQRLSPTRPTFASPARGEEIGEQERGGNESLQHKSPIKLLLSLEGASPLMGSVHNLRVFHRLGLRALGLTWNHRNELADGVGVAPGPSGLTEAGFAVLKECERLGIIVDVSHLSEPGFWDVSNASTKPYIASHSNAKAVCDFRRNLTDRQIEALAEKGGTIGLTFVRDFVVAEIGTSAASDTGTGTSKEGASPPVERTSPSLQRGGGAGEGDPDLPGLVNHAHHIAKVGGIAAVAVGSDFDGTGGPVVRDAAEFPTFAAALHSSGFTDAEVGAIFNANLHRVLWAVL
ncbi:MAG: dipeptidase [bacterium]